MSLNFIFYSVITYNKTTLLRYSTANNMIVSRNDKARNIRLVRKLLFFSSQYQRCNDDNNQLYVLLCLAMLGGPGGTNCGRMWHAPGLDYLIRPN